MIQHITDQVIIGGQAVDRATLVGLKDASVKSGVSFQYLLAKAAQESSLKTDAQAEGSSAAGLFQFTRGTWLEMIKRYGAESGLNNLASKILTGSNGRATVNDKDVESQILALRDDPEVSALMAAHYAQDNADALEGMLGHAPDAPDLYLAHFLGATGAGLLLNTADDKPDTAAATLMPAAAKANRSVFYDSDGEPRTAAGVVKLVRDRFASQLTRFAGAATQLASAAPLGSPMASAAAAPIATAASPVNGTASPFDLRGAMQSGNASQMLSSWYMMQELAKLIAAKPMTMSEDADFGMDQSLSSGGLQGGDWTSALTTALTRDLPTASAPPAAPPSRARAYDALNTPVAAHIDRRKDSHT